MGSNLWLVSSFVHYRFAGTIPFFGIMINLQHFGSNIFLFQVIFGALTISVRCLALYPLNNVGRRPTQMFFMFLVGLSILINMFVPQGAEVVSGSPKSFPVRSWVLASPRAGNDQNLRCRGLGPLGLLALLGVRVHWPEFWGSGHCSPLVNASAITHPRG